MPTAGDPGAIAVRARGVDWYDWEEVFVERSMLQPAGGFALRAANRSSVLSSSPVVGLPTEGPRSALIDCGDEVEILYGQEHVLKGHVDDSDVQISDNEHSLALVGRDLVADLVDCHAIGTHVAAEYRNRDAFAIITSLTGPFRTKVRFDNPNRLPRAAFFGDPLKSFGVEPTETVWRAIDRLCSEQGLLAFSDEDGTLVVARAADEPRRAQVSLVYGRNVKSWRLQKRDAQRFSHYVVKAQRQASDLDWGRNNCTVLGQARDAGVGRFRPFAIVAETGVNVLGAARLAEWEASVRAAQSRALVVVVPGWGQTLDPAESAPPWRLNHLVPVELPPLRISGELLIGGLRFIRSPTGGTCTELTLVRPDSFITQPVIEAADSPLERLRGAVEEGG